MADKQNAGQFGNRKDTKEMASKGGKASPGKFGSPKGADPSEAGRKGGKASRTKKKSQESQENAVALQEQVSENTIG